MNLDRIHNHCTSLAVSAMLTAAFFSTAPDGLIAAGIGPLGAAKALESTMSGLRADGWHGAAGMGVPAAIAAAQTRQVTTQPEPAPSPFTGIQLEKLNRYWDSHPKEIEILTKYSRLLGLTKGDEVVRARKIGGKDENGILHIFARFNNGVGYYLSREPSPDDMHLYWVGPDFKVIAAISVSKGNDTEVLAVQDAEKELQSEYADWAKVANKL